MNVKAPQACRCLLQLLIFAFSLCFFLPDAFGADTLVQRTQKAYRELRDIKGTFVQQSHIRDLGRTDTFTGTFMIKVPSKMRWLYSGSGGQQTEVTIRGDEIIIYQKREKQAFKGTFDRQTYGQAPLALLGGFGEIEKDFSVTEKQGKLLLRPRKPMGTVVSVEITPSDGDFPIGALTIVDERSNRVTITFKNVSVNSGLPDGRFDVFLPPDVTTFDSP